MCRMKIYNIIIMCCISLTPEKGVEFMDWSQKELEELYQKVNQLASTDADFRKELQENAHAAIERIAGKKLPEGFRLETIETDLSYNRTFVAPDFAPGELNLRDLKSVAGGQGEEQSDGAPSQGEGQDVGISIMAIVSVCGVAGGVGPCPADACGAQGCGGDICGGHAGGAEGCVGDICSVEACGAAGCIADGCVGEACLGDVCAAAGCMMEACAGAGCIADGCAGNACAGDGCFGEACGTATCTGYGNPDEGE